MVLLVATVAAVVWHAKDGKTLSALVSFALAALCAWRFSFHATMWDATEYGGAYTSEAEMGNARKRYRVWSVATCVIALGAIAACLLLLG